MSTTAQPWGMSRLAPYRNTVALPYTRTELDETTQTTLYFDGAGEPVEMAKHGTSKVTSTSTSTGPDGGGPNPPAPTDSDSYPDTESD